ncbi:hypothetical protein HK102_008138, partial [Quaeritorhiza haematococci]
MSDQMPATALEALQTMYAKDISDRLKDLEKQVDVSIAPTQPFVIRLDGVAFSTFTRGLKKPFDDRLTEALVNVTQDLVAKFNAVLGYHQSDEISLVFPAAMPKEEEVKVEPSVGQKGEG